MVLAPYIAIIVLFVASLSCTKKANNDRVLLPATAELDNLAIFDSTQPTPQKLSELGIFAELSPLTANDGLLPYIINQGYWSDGAEKRRWIYLKPNAQVNLNEAKFLNLPNESIVIKHFDLPTAAGPQPLETRILIKNDDSWRSLSYQWNSGKTDAELIDDVVEENFTWASPEGGIKEIKWYFPAGECYYCHNEVSDQVAGLSLAQLDLAIDYGNGAINQIEAWQALGWLSPDLTATRTTPKNIDETVSLRTRARSYLDINCAICHRPGGFEDTIDLRFNTDLSPLLTQAIKFGDLGIDDAKILSTNPAKSLLYQRMLVTDENHMPYISSRVVDEAGSALIEEWLKSGDF